MINSSKKTLLPAGKSLTQLLNIFSWLNTPASDMTPTALPLPPHTRYIRCDIWLKFLIVCECSSTCYLSCHRVRTTPITFLAPLDGSCSKFNNISGQSSSSVHCLSELIRLNDIRHKPFKKCISQNYFASAAEETRLLDNTQLYALETSHCQQDFMLWKISCFMLRCKTEFISEWDARKYYFFNLLKSQAIAYTWSASFNSSRRKILHSKMNFKLKLVRRSSNSFYRDFYRLIEMLGRKHSSQSTYVRESSWKKSHLKVDQEAMNIKPASERD